MQYTLRNVPDPVDRALRELARREGRSLNDVTVEALTRAVGLGDGAVRYRTLDEIRGTWREDPEFDRALEEQDRVDEELWR
jgi:hypothetical protein